MTPQQIEQLADAARRVGRHGHRDATLIMVLYVHALRVSEVISLRWDQIDIDARLLNVHRINKGRPSKHAIAKDELNALSRLRQEATSEFVFYSERGGPLNRRSVLAVIARAGKVAGLPFSVHPYMVRHARGYELAAKGVDIRSIQAYMGHRNIQHTAVYKPSASQELFDFDD